MVDCMPDTQLWPDLKNDSLAFGLRWTICRNAKVWVRGPKPQILGTLRWMD
jgi:hypothetical protein